MRILLVNKAYPPVIGGIERHVQTLARGLASRGHEVSVLVCSERFRREVLEDHSVRVIKVPSPGKVSSMHLGPTTPLWLRNLPADLIHVHLPYPMADLATFLVRPKQPVIATWHSDIVRQRRLLRLYQPLGNWFLRRADRILVTSPALKEKSPGLALFQGKCRVVPLGVDLSRLTMTPEIETRARGICSQEKRPIILFVGRLVKYKGLEYLLKAMVGTEAMLDIVGDGPLRGKLETLCQEMQLDGSVCFHGVISDNELTALYHVCEMLVLPSIERNEAFGLVQLEAMACGKPVISTNLPTGVPYVNLHGETGIIVPPRDSDALRRAMKDLLGDPDRRRILGRRGSARVRELFTADRMVGSVLENYRDLLGGRAETLRPARKAGGALPHEEA